jgi:hypothetical protein
MSIGMFYYVPYSIILYIFIGLQTTLAFLCLCYNRERFIEFSDEHNAEFWRNEAYKATDVAGSALEIANQYKELYELVSSKEETDTT